MQQLHLVGFTTDLDSLIFSARKGAKSGGFVLPMDEVLLATIAEAIRRRLAEGDDLEVPAELLAPSPAPRRQSQLSPREIQARLRAGRSMEEIAASAGVGEEWVARFAAPVEAERLRIVTRARDLIFMKPRRGESSDPLGMAVRWNLADRGVRLTNGEFDGCWSAYQVNDQVWMVTFTFESRKRSQVAEWELDLLDGELVSRNRLATDLGYTETSRRRRSVASLQPSPARQTRRRDTDTDSDDEDQAAPSAKKTAAKKTASRKTAAKKTAAKKTPAKKTPSKKTAARKAPAKKTASKKTASKKTAPARKATARTAPAKKRAATKAAASRKAPGAAAPVAPPAARAVSADELGRRRLEMVRASDGARPTAPTRRPTAGLPARVRDATPESQSSPLDDVGRRPPARPSTPDRAATERAGAERRSARRSARAVRLPLPSESAQSGGPAQPAPVMAPAASVAPKETNVASESTLDVPTGDGRVVTIRADRARGTAGQSPDGAAVPLRAAQPARRPDADAGRRRRRFSRDAT